MKTACALLATYNEADVVYESVSKLIADGVEVFVIDNCSTDRTLEILGPLVGKGIVDIRTVKFYEGDREVYDWGSLLKMKEELSRELGFDWFLHVDADEIRYAPWPGLSLREGLDRVDRSGYNLVNFKLFNFRLTEDLLGSDDYERDMPWYSPGEYFNQYQVKAWKAHRDINITANGGHIARRPDGKLFPLRFIHKHYPVRSLEHGRRKILHERKKRFSNEEKARGWHVQYDQMVEVQPHDVFWTTDKLTLFDMQRECLSLLEEGCYVACNLLSTVNIDTQDTNMERALVQRFSPAPFTPEHARKLMAVSRQLMDMASKGVIPPMKSTADEIAFMRSALQLLASRHWLTGDASIIQRVSTVTFIPT